MPAYVITYLQVTDLMDPRRRARRRWERAPHAVSVSAYLTSRSALSPR